MLPVEAVEESAGFAAKGPERNLPRVMTRENIVDTIDTLLLHDRKVCRAFSGTIGMIDPGVIATQRPRGPLATVVLVMGPIVVVYHRTSVNFSAGRHI